MTTPASAARWGESTVSSRCASRRVLVVPWRLPCPPHLSIHHDDLDRAETLPAKMRLHVAPSARDQARDALEMRCKCPSASSRSIASGVSCGDEASRPRNIQSSAR